ncbi:MAG: AEC family transporter [Pseudomonadota bacterium]
MQGIAYGLIPIAAVIALGWGLRRSNLVPSELWAGINKIGYVALLPVLLYKTIAEAELGGLETGSFLLAATLGFLVMAAIAVALKPLLRTDEPSFTSIFQGGIRWNGFVILALAQTALSPQAATLTAIVFAPTVPLINVLCVAALSVWGSHEGSVSLQRVGFRIVTNPLIIGCCVGVAATMVPLLQQPLMLETADLIGRAALPLILLSVGAGLNFSAIGERPHLLSLAIALKLIIAPVVFIVLGSLFGASAEVIVLLAAIGAAPGAASSYVLAKELGGNAELTAGHVTATTLLAFVSIPFWIAAARSLQLL